MRDVIKLYVEKGAYMKICPAIFKQYNLSNKGQLNNNTFSSKATLNYQNQNDAFVRLAIASTRDSKIEQELRNMDLIV